MKTAAVIAEFNPFHRGHAYLLEQIRIRSRADHIIVLMSGDYVQRGEPAVFDKYERTEAALSGEADLVLELPLRYACANAGDFASGAAELLSRLGAVDELWFGSESGEIGLFRELAEVLSRETKEFREALAGGLKNGLPYPKARAEAILKTADLSPLDLSAEELRLFLEAPNNILGLEYCIALHRQDSPIVPMTVKRIGSGHHSTDPSGDYPSASALREQIRNSASSCPDPDTGMTPVFADDFSLPLKYRLMSADETELASFAGVSADLAGRIRNHLNKFRSFTQFADLLKTRNLTRTHVNRALLHILLNIRKEKERPELKTLHLLGMRDCGSLLRVIKEKGNISLCSSSSELKDPSYAADLFASGLYETVRSMKSRTPFVHDFERRLIHII